MSHEITPYQAKHKFNNMVKHTAREFRTLARRVRQLEKLVEEKDRTAVEKDKAASEKDAAAGEFMKQVVFAKAHYDKQLAIERNTNEILRKSLKNFSVPLYTMKRTNKKLHAENMQLRTSLRRTTASKKLLEQGIERLKLLHELGRRKRRRETTI